MSNFNTIINYIKTEIDNLKKLYNLEALDLESEELSQTLNLLDTDIDKVNINLIKTLLNSSYSSEIANEKLDFFQEIIDLKDYLVDCTDVQIQECIKFLNELKELILAKIVDIKNDKISAENRINEYNNYLKLINEFGLVRFLSTSELEDLLNFIISSKLDKDIVASLITDLTISNIEQYEKQQVINETKEDELEELKENVATVTGLLDLEVEEELNDELELIDAADFGLQDDKDLELNEEEQKLYDEMTEICQIIEEQNIKSVIDIRKMLSKIAEQDFSLSDIRQKMYSTKYKGDNRWLLILSDLKNNLLPNYKEHKTEIKPVFEFIKTIFKENFIKKEEYLKQIPELYSKKEVNELLADYDKFIKHRGKSPSQQKISMLEFKNYIGYSYFMKLHELHLKDYDFLSKLTCEKQEFEIRLNSLKELNTEILQLVEEIKKQKNKMDQIVSDKEVKKMTKESVEEKAEEKVVESEKSSETFINLPVFFQNNSLNIHDTILLQREAIKNNTSYANLVVTKNIQAIDNLLNQREENSSKSKINEEELSFIVKPLELEIDEKISAVVTYVKIPVSKNNSKKLKQYFELNHLNNLYVIINQDMDINDKKRYLKNTKDILSNQDMYLEYLKTLFSTDFTEETFEIAKTLIEDSLAEFKTMQEELSKDSKVVGGDN